MPDGDLRTDEFPRDGRLRRELQLKIPTAISKETMDSEITIFSLQIRSRACLRTCEGKSYWIYQLLFKWTDSSNQIFTFLCRDFDVFSTTY